MVGHDGSGDELEQVGDQEARWISLLGPLKSSTRRDPGVYHAAPAAGPVDA